MLVWLSKPLQRERNWRMDCLQSQSAKALSHDHLFHSMLGLSQVDTRLAKPELDLFAACSPGR
jgi:lipid A ethanolaminephosphotransferase